MEIKIKTEKMETIEITVSLPWYRKNNCKIWKVISPTHCIGVSTDWTDRSYTADIDYNGFISTVINNADQDSNEQEFSEALNNAIEFIKNKHFSTN